MDDAPEPREERRHRQPGRRGADAVAFTEAAALEAVVDDVQLVAEIARKAQNISISWKKIMVLMGTVAAASGMIGGAVNWLGGRYLSPSEAFQEHKTETAKKLAADSAATQTMAARVAIVEQRVENAEEAIDFMSYLLCVQIRKSDPTALPPRCNEQSIRRFAPR